jgi:uncharacterized membrane protein YgdD (TMEM256/DUF423 family)
MMVKFRLQITNQHLSRFGYIRVNFYCMKNIFTISACISGAVSVLLGAFAAHSLKSMVSEEALRIFHTGVEYQFYHTFALFATGIFIAKTGNNLVNASGYFFLSGITLFSGSLYLLAVSPAFHWAGFITPIGGLSFITGWILLLVAVIKSA